MKDLIIEYRDGKFVQLTIDGIEMKRVKRTRSDSSAAAVQAMKNAAVDTIDPPSHAGLEKKAEPFWHDNIRSKALDSWTPADLLAAVELANNQLYITVLRKDLRKEERKRGEGRDEGLIKDLRKQIVELQRTILAQRRDLQIYCLRVKPMSTWRVR